VLVSLAIHLRTWELQHPRHIGALPGHRANLLIRAELLQRRKPEAREEEGVGDEGIRSRRSFHPAGPSPNPGDSLRLRVFVVNPDSDPPGRREDTKNRETTERHILG